MTILKNIWNSLLNLFFPNLCLICKRPLVGNEKHICLNCFCNLPRTQFHRRTQNPMERRYYGQVVISHATSFLLYQKEEVAQKLVHSFKYYGNKELAYYLGRIAALELQQDNHPICQMDALIPVPLHPRKKRTRGYNQSEWIAKGIQSVWGCALYPDALRRTQVGESQTHKSGYERWNLPEKMFIVNPTHNLSGKHLLIIDDVITTGSTIGACAMALSSLPDIRISLFSLATAIK